MNLHNVLIRILPATGKESGTVHPSSLPCGCLRSCKIGMFSRTELRGGMAKHRLTPLFSHFFAQRSLWGFFLLCHTPGHPHPLRLYRAFLPNVCFSWVSRHFVGVWSLSVVVFIMGYRRDTGSAGLTLCTPSGSSMVSRGHSQVVSIMCEVVVENVSEGDTMMIKSSVPLPGGWLFKRTWSVTKG